MNYTLVVNKKPFFCLNVNHIGFAQVDGNVLATIGVLTQLLPVELHLGDTNNINLLR